MGEDNPINLIDGSDYICCDKSSANFACSSQNLLAQRISYSLKDHWFYNCTLEDRASYWGKIHYFTHVSNSMSSIAEKAANKLDNRYTTSHL